MDFIKKRETDAIFRMMLYIKHELIRNEYLTEANDIQNVIDNLEEKMKNFAEDKEI